MNQFTSIKRWFGVYEKRIDSKVKRKLGYVSLFGDQSIFNSNILHVNKCAEERERERYSETLAQNYTVNKGSVSV